jgi:hypothetical protein
VRGRAALALLADGRAQSGGEALTMPRAHGLRISAFRVTTLLSGSPPRPAPQSILGRNVSAGRLAEVAVAPGDSTHLVLTQMQGGHVGSMPTEAGDLTHPNAAFLTGPGDHDAWAAMENEGFDAKARPLAEQFSFLGDGDRVRR